MGFRFDTIIALYAILTFVLISIISLFFKSSFNSLKIVIFTLFFVLFFLLTIIHFYYYKFFQDNINILFFGLFEDDTQAVLTSVWTDYPFIWLFLLTIGASYLAHLYFKKIIHIKFKTPHLPLIPKILMVIVFFFLLFFGIRGRLTVFPLKSEDKVICHHYFINRVSGNCVFDLINAYSRKKEYTVKAIHPEEAVKKYDFSSAQEAISLYVNRSVANHPDSLIAALKNQTAHNDFLEENPPNVVVILYESMSNYFMSLNNNTNFNLLGELNDVLPEVYLFDHIFPSTGSTISALENMVINNYYFNVSQSNFYNVPFAGATALPFYDAGYKTFFYTSAKLGWRNQNNFLPYQYFQETAGSEIINKVFPDCKEETWGIYDEFLFNYAFKRLSENEGKPVYLFALTTTNHTPYEMPDIDYPDLTNLPEDITTKEEIALKAFKAFRYTNDCLGRFIKKIKNSSLAENTIIVVTGDHNARGIFNYADNHKYQKYSVPLLYFVPEKYRPNTNVNLQSFGSHKDIFPTIYNIALSDAVYMKTGVNLFNPEESENNFGICEFSMIFDNNGYFQLNEPGSYMSWDSNLKNSLIFSPKSPLFEESNIRGNAFLASMAYYMAKNLYKSDLNVK
jgi:phosphoglycerol transferase MdoB-like AlkP superfamily enzyme